jgi:hypothetical protein
MSYLFTSFAIATTIALTGCKGQEHQRVEFPTQPGHYLQVYERDGKQWLEIAQVNSEGKIRHAAGLADPESDLSKRLPRTAVNFEDCGRGTFLQPQISLGKVFMGSWEGATVNCELQNLPKEFDRLNTNKQ